MDLDKFLTGAYKPTNQDALSSEQLLKLYWYLKNQSETKDRSENYWKSSLLTIENQAEQIKKMQRESIRQAKLATVGMLTAGVNHEIGNALHSMHGALIYLARCVESKTYDDRKVAMSVDLISRGVDRAKKIVKSMSQVSRADEEKSIVNVSEAIEECLLLSADKIKQSGVKIDASVPADLEVKFAPSSLVQILLNFVGNAADATRGLPTPTIRIYTEEDETGVSISVHDNGKGVPEDAVETIFEPFFTTKPADHGTGLGLHLCLGFAEANDSEISLHNVNGAKFSLRIRKTNV